MASQTHPLEVNSDTNLAIIENVSISVRVIGYIYNGVDTAYHYHLQGELTDGNNTATAQFEDIHQSLIILNL